MHGFFPGAFFFGPALLFFGLMKFLLLALLIMLIVRLVTHGHRRGAYAVDSYGRGHGYGPGPGYGAQDLDPRRIAAWRYASGQIDQAEYDRIVAGLSGSATGPTAPPTAPTA